MARRLNRVQRGSERCTLHREGRSTKRYTNNHTRSHEIPLSFKLEFFVVGGGGTVSVADKGGETNEWTGWIVARFNLRVDDEFPLLCENF